MPTTVKDEKGSILFLSHRELPLFSLMSVVCRSLMVELVEKHTIILHVGAYYRFLKLPWWCDYLLTSPGNIGKLICDNDKFINLSSRDVLPDCFNNHGVDDRKWDAVYVANNSKNKRVREYFELVKACPQFKFALVLSYSDSQDPDKFDIPIIREVKSYSSSANSNLTLFDAVKTENDEYSLSRNDISDILNNSKVYIHFCRREGESRSTGEALACGCYVIVNNILVGGANDVCLDYNSSRYIDANDLISTLARLLEQPIDHERISDGYLKSKKNAINTFVEILHGGGLSESVITYLTTKTDLSMFLPGHLKPAFKAKGSNADINNLMELEYFLNSINIEYSTLRLKLLWATSSLRDSIKKTLLNIRYRVKI